MLGIFLKIVSILGWLLLTLLIVLIFALLLVLFYPVFYCIEWERYKDKMSVKVKAHWILGLLRVRCFYPDPGNVVVSLLGLTVYDGKKSQTNSSRIKPKKKRKRTVSEAKKESLSEKSSISGSSQDADKMESFEDMVPNGKLGIFERIRKKMQELLEKFCEFYEKLLHVKELFWYYLELLKEEDSKLLFSNIFLRAVKIIKSIRPRKLKGEVYFGTGSPDTTGLLMGLYGMLSPSFGQNLIVTPDFEQRILEGQLFARGRVTVVTFLVHGLHVGLDHRLRSFIKKFKREVS